MNTTKDPNTTTTNAETNSGNPILDRLKECEFFDASGKSAWKIGETIYSDKLEALEILKSIYYKALHDKSLND